MSKLEVTRQSDLWETVRDIILLHLFIVYDGYEQRTTWLVYSGSENDILKYENQVVFFTLFNGFMLKRLKTIKRQISSFSYENVPISSVFFKSNNKIICKESVFSVFLSQLPAKWARFQSLFSSTSKRNFYYFRKMWCLQFF